MRTLAVVLVVLALAAVGADRVAEKVAADRAEQRLAAEGVRDPQVDVRGFPFLTQLLARRFAEVRVTGSAVAGAGGRARDIAITGRDVTLPRSGQARVAAVRASGLVPYDEVLRRSGAPGVRLEPADGGRVRLRGDARVLGRTVSVAAVGRVSARGRTIRVTPSSLEVDGTSLDGSLVAAALADRFSFTYRLRDLPDGLRLRSVTPRPAGFEVLVTGRDVTVGG